MARIKVNKADGRAITPQALVGAEKTTFSNRGTSMAFVTYNGTDAGDKLKLSSFRNSGGKDFESASDEVELIDTPNDEVYIIGNLLAAIYNNSESQVEVLSDVLGDIAIVDIAS